MNELALFAGAGGGILGGYLLGWRTICAVERDAYAAQILAQRQNDGILRPFPIWSDVETFDGTRWRGRVDVISGGFPCQDISTAGKGAGITGKRSGLWKEFARIIGEVRPRYVYVENSPALTSRGLGVVLGDLAEMGYDAEWGVLAASDVGAPHKRERIWILATNSNELADGEQYAYEKKRNDGKRAHTEMAYSDSLRKLQQEGSEQDERGRIGYSSEEISNTSSIGQQGQGRSIEWSDSAQKGERKTNNIITNSGWASEPDVGRMANGVAFGMDRLKAIGNGQVPIVAATAFNELRRRLEE